MESGEQSMINVLYVLNESILGGAAQSLLDMIEADRSRIRAVVVIPSMGDVEERLQQLQIHYYIVPFRIDYKGIGTHASSESDAVFISNYLAALKLQKIIREEEIQLIHSNSSVSNVGIMAALTAGIPHVWHIRELLEEHYDCEFLDWEWKRDFLECSDRIISISDFVKKTYTQKYGIDSICIYDGLNIERFMCNDFSEKKEDYFILAGVISPPKGQMEAIEAVKELVAKGIGIKLFIVGSADYQYRWILKKKIKQYGLESNIAIFTFRKDLRELRKKCQYAIISSRMEALGRVTVEAMMSGCVAIGADTGGTAEIIGKNFDRGYLYRQGDKQDLARVIQYAMGHGEKNAVIRESAQRHVLEQFDSKQYIEKIIGIYNDLTQEKEMAHADKKVELLGRMRSRFENITNTNKNIVQSCGQNIIKKRVLEEITQRWLSVKLENKFLSDALLQRQIQTVAIYGMGYLGCCVYDELENSRVEAVYVMDQRMHHADAGIRIVGLEDSLPKVDAVIITVLWGISEVCSLIKTKCDYRILTLEEILDWCEEL